MDDYYENRTSITQTILSFAIVIILVCLFIYGLWWTALRLNRVETMTVRDKGWSRAVYEYEDYSTYECHSTTNYITVGKVRTPVHSTSCGWETHTRMTNRWVTSGMFPTKPYWPTYTLSPGRYEGRSESYLIHLSNSKEELYPYAITGEAYYDTISLREKCLVGMNWLGFIIKVEC